MYVHSLQLENSWTSDRWVAGSNPTQRHVSPLISPHCPRRLFGPVNLNNVHKGGLQHNLISIVYLRDMVYIVYLRDMVYIVYLRDKVYIVYLRDKVYIVYLRDKVYIVYLRDKVYIVYLRDKVYIYIYLFRTNSTIQQMQCKQ